MGSVIQIQIKMHSPGANLSPQNKAGCSLGLLGDIIHRTSSAADNGTSRVVVFWHIRQHYCYPFLHL